METCRRVFYEGYVQGVGFRYRATQIASDYSVTGFVRNLPDGRVELVAEGEEGEVREFLDRVKESMSQHIRRAEESREPCSHEYADFSIG